MFIPVTSKCDTLTADGEVNHPILQAGNKTEFTEISHGMTKMAYEEIILMYRGPDKG